MPDSLEEKMTVAAREFIDGITAGAGENAPAVVRAVLAAFAKEAGRRRLTEPVTLAPERRKWIIDRLVAYDIYQAQRMLSPQHSEAFWKWVDRTLRSHQPYNDMSDEAIAELCDFLGLGD